MNWIKLNNQVIIKDNEGKYQLDKDKEALGRAKELLTVYIAEGNTDRRLVKAQQIIIDLSNEGR